MATPFQIIFEEFSEDLDAIKLVVQTFSETHQTPKARIAAANSATLLLAATFEEFVRETAREYARAVVNRTASIDKLPTKLIPTAWKRTMEGLARMRLDQNTLRAGSENVFRDAQARFSVVYEFCKGDLSQNVYDDLIHNDNNMRPGELNSLFNLSGVSDVCKQIAANTDLLDYLGELELGKAHGKLIDRIENFFERRNGIAHSLNPGKSTGPEQIFQDIALLERFGHALCETLNGLEQTAEVQAQARAQATAPAVAVTENEATAEPPAQASA